MLLCRANAFNVPTCAYINWCVRAAVAPPRPEPTQKIQCNFQLGARGMVQNEDEALERRVRTWNWNSTSVTQNKKVDSVMKIKNRQKYLGWECYRFATTAGPRALAGFSAPWLKQLTIFTLLELLMIVMLKMFIISLFRDNLVDCEPSTVGQSAHCTRFFSSRKWKWLLASL